MRPAYRFHIGSPAASLKSLRLPGLASKQGVRRFDQCSGLCKMKKLFGTAWLQVYNRASRE